jgi:hypothetical protein
MQTYCDMERCRRTQPEPHCLINASIILLYGHMRPISDIQHYTIEHCFIKQLTINCVINITKCKRQKSHSRANKERAKPKEHRRTRNVMKRFVLWIWWYTPSFYFAAIDQYDCSSLDVRLLAPRCTTASPSMHDC